MTSKELSLFREHLDIGSMERLLETILDGITVYCYKLLNLLEENKMSFFLSFYRRGSENMFLGLAIYLRACSLLIKILIKNDLNQNGEFES